AAVDSLKDRIAVEAREALEAHLAALFADEPTRAAPAAAHDEDGELATRAPDWSRRAPRIYREESLLLLALLRTLWRLSYQETHDLLCAWPALALACGLPRGADGQAAGAPQGQAIQAAADGRGAGQRAAVRAAGAGRALDGALACPRSDS